MTKHESPLTDPINSAVTVTYVIIISDACHSKKNYVLLTNLIGDDGAGGV